MTIDQMRDKLLTAYSGDKWANRVKTMPDKQVLAVYSRLLNQKKL